MYVELYDIIEDRLKGAGFANVGSALSAGRPLPSVELWIAKNIKPDPNVAGSGSVGNPRKIIIGINVTVAKSGIDGGSHRQALGILDQVEPLLHNWKPSVIGMIGKIQQEEGGVKSFSSDSDSVYSSLFSCHIYVEQFEVK